MIEKKRTLRINSSPDGIHELEAFVEDICYEYNILNTYYSNIQLALNEAFNNALIHGNKMRVDSVIEIDFFSDVKGLHFIVKDEGEGFDYYKYLDYGIENLPEEDGKGKRGILVIKMLVDEINFLGNGSSIELIFYISSINYNLTLERKKYLEQYFKSVTLYKAE